jgi:oligoribonuclease
MKYISVDIETTGLRPDTHDVVEVGAVIDDFSNPKPLDELPTFHCYVRMKNYVTDPYCSFLHQAIFHRISKWPSKEVTDRWNFYTPDEVVHRFADFLKDNGVEAASDGRYTLTAAGKNFGSFDLQFLNKKLDFNKKIRFRHRFLDPGILFFDPRTDTVIPSQQECLERAGSFEQVEHTAVEDAMQVVKLLRHHYLGED